MMATNNSTTQLDKGTSPPQMDIRVECASVDTSANPNVVRPGDTVRGRIRVSSEVPLHFSRVEVVLLGES